MVKTAILGGGLTGITLARLLTENGHDVVVLEREPKIGGLCRSLVDDGFTFDIGGSHIIFSRDSEVLDFMRAVLSDNKDMRSRNTKILYKNGYIGYPFENHLYQLPRDDLFFCIHEFIKTQIALEKGDLEPPANFCEWIHHTFGRGIAECYMVPYNEKIWNCPTEAMSHHWVDGRIPRPPVEDILRSAIGIETDGYTHQAEFTYPVTGGIESLVNAIASPVEDCIRTNFEVSSVRREEGEGNFVIRSSGGEVAEAERCISTIPLQALLSYLEDVPQGVQEACDALCYNSLCCVFIGLEGEVPDYSWLYVPQKDLGEFNRISFPSNYSTAVAPPGHSSILAEITYNEGDHISGMSDEAVIGSVVERLERIGIIKDPSQIVYTGIEWQRFAYVVYDLGYPGNISLVREFCADQEVSLVGRFSQFEYLNMDGCIRSAIDFSRTFQSTTPP